MPEKEGINFRRVTASRIITKAPCLFWGAVILTSTTGGDATVYSGQDATGGRQIFCLEGIADQSTPIMLSKPAKCPGGLYVAVGSNVTEVTVFWEAAD